MKFKGKAKLSGMPVHYEHVSHEGRIIASFKNGECEVDDPAVASKLKDLGYESVGEVKPVEEAPKEKKVKK